jgi:hypothetical protein
MLIRDVVSLQLGGTSRLFRWKWLADVAAWRHRHRPRGVVRGAIVEALQS